jgi:nucleotide-binding universal stress UspA family protein
MTTPFRKIVIGVDFSDASLAGARWVASHLAPQAELLVVHVVPVPSAPIYLREYIGATVDQRASSAQRLYTALRGFACLLGADRVRVGIRTGVPWCELSRVADQVKADLICVGRGQKRQGSSRFGATTPQRLLAIARVPVLVIPQGVVTKPVRVLAAISAREGEDRITTVAKGLADTWSSRVATVHVVETEVHRTSRTSALNGAGDPMGAPTRQAGRCTGIDSLDESALRALAAEWLTSTGTPTDDEQLNTRIVRVGDAGQELIATARDDAGSSAIVMGRVSGTHAATHSGAGYHCGSTTRIVLWSAPGPVFVLPLESGVEQLLSERNTASDSGLLLPAHHRNGERVTFLAPAGRDAGARVDSAWAHHDAP